MIETNKHKPTEFIELKKDIPDKLSIGSFGEAGSGKTEFIASMPDPIAVIPLDRKTRRTLKKANEKYKKKILFPPQDFIRHENPLKLAMMKPEEAIKYYTEHKNRIMDAIYTAASKSEIVSVAIDSGTQLHEDIMFSHFGRAQRIMPRDRGGPNQDMRDILNALQDKHTLITHFAEEIWKNDQPTGKFEHRGYKYLKYSTNIIIEHKFDKVRQEFSISLRECQDRPDLLGAKGEKILTNEDINFENLAAIIYPKGNW